MRNNENTEIMLRWVKGSDRLPDNQGAYHVKWVIDGVLDRLTLSYCDGKFFEGNPPNEEYYNNSEIEWLEEKESTPLEAKKGEAAEGDWNAISGIIMNVLGSVNNDTNVHIDLTRQIVAKLKSRYAQQSQPLPVSTEAMQIRNKIIDLRNEAHVNCEEEFKNAMNQVIVLIDNMNPSTPVLTDKELEDESKVIYPYPNESEWEGVNQIRKSDIDKQREAHIRARKMGVMDNTKAGEIFDKGVEIACQRANDGHINPFQKDILDQHKETFLSQFK